MSSTQDHSAQSNPAVFRCREAWRAAYKARLAEAQNEESARAAARNAPLLPAQPQLCQCADEPWCGRCSD